MNTQFDKNGKPIDEIYLELSLPPYLEHDLKELRKWEKENVDFLDCLQDEVYGSINAAYHGNQITEEQARYLRKKYLGIS